MAKHIDPQFWWAIIAIILALSAWLWFSDPARGEGEGVYSVSSTAYCDNGVMAWGEWVYDGAVAVLPGDGRFDRHGLRIEVLTGPQAARVFTVADHIGWGSEFDWWTPDCGAAIAYGRRQITVRVLLDAPDLSQFKATTRPLGSLIWLKAFYGARTR